MENKLAAITRTDNDSLGQIAVPANAYYGAQTQRALENFPISGLKPFPAFVHAVAVIKLCAARVHAELGILEDSKAEAIQKAAREVMDGRFGDQFLVDPYQAGAGTSHHMNVNEVIANRATEIMGGKLGEYLVHPNDDVNKAQSTNDVIPTAIRLACLSLTPALVTQLKASAQIFHKKSIQFDPILKSGRTHLQDAAPIRLGQEFSGYARAIERDLETLIECQAGLLRIGIGGTAVGTGLNAHPEYARRMVQSLSTETGLDLIPSDNLFESMQSMSDFARFSGTLRTIASTYHRIANDLRLLASGPTSGLDEIRLPAVQPGSTIMPGKVNPVIPEMMNMVCFHIFGCDTTVSMACQAGQLELNVMMPVIAHHLLDMLSLLTSAVMILSERCVEGIEANQHQASRLLARNPILATALNPLIGYQAAARLVHQAMDSDLPIQEVAREKAASGELINLSTGGLVSAAEIDQIFTDLWLLTGR